MSGSAWSLTSRVHMPLVSRRFETMKRVMVSPIVSHLKPPKCPQLWGKCAVVSLMVSQVKLHSPPWFHKVHPPLGGNLETTGRDHGMRL